MSAYVCPDSSHEWSAEEGAGGEGTAGYGEGSSMIPVTRAPA